MDPDMINCMIFHIHVEQKKVSLNKLSYDFFNSKRLFRMFKFVGKCSLHHNLYRAAATVIT